MAKNTWEGYVTQNQVFLASVEKRMTELAAVQTKHREAMQAIRDAANFEVQEKAEMKEKMFDVATSKKLVTSAQQAEKEIKSAITSAKKIKVQKCGVMKLAIEEYKAKEGAMVQAEAANKYLTAQEKTETAGKKLTTKRNNLLEATTAERRMKAKVEVNKATEASAKKKNKEATSERLKKGALTEQNSSKESLEKSTEDLANSDNKRRLKKEMSQKAKENYTKAKESEAKAENNVKSKKREATMKQETILVNKKIRAKQESGVKSEGLNKAAKKQELLKRKHQEVVEKGRLKLSMLTTDESHKKTEIRDDEKRYKDIAKSSELNEKANETKNKRTTELARAERDSKYAVRKAALTTQVLAENEADTKTKMKTSEQETEDAKAKAKADELKEKDAAVALKKATNEKDTKKLMRTELNWKSVYSKSNELVTKADQQKMLAIEDNTQAQSKMQANKCVELCQKGLELKQQEFMAKEAVPAGFKAPAVELLEVAEGKHTKRQKVKSAAVQAAEASEVKMMPTVTAFKYKGCSC